PLRRAGPGEAGGETLAGVQTRAHGAGPAARTAPEALRHAPAPSRGAGSPGARDGQQLPPGAALPSGVAADLRAVGPALRAREVGRAAVSSGCACWRDGRLAHQRLARTTLPDLAVWPGEEEAPLRALACVPLRHACPAGSLLGVSGAVR